MVRHNSSRKFILGSLLTLLCQSPCSAAPSPSAKIGVISPLSGALAEYGTAVRNGATLVLEDTKSEPSRIDWDDSKGDTKSAVSAFRKLATENDVAAVFGWGATPSEAIGPIAEEQHLPFLAASISPTLAKGRKYVMRSVSPSTELVAALADHVRSSNLKKMMLLTAEWTYTEELSKALKSSVGATVSVDEMTFTREDQDFRTAISKIRSGGYDAVGVLLSTGQISGFYRQLATAHLQVATFGSDFFSSQKEITDSGTAIEGAIFPNLAVCPEFAKRYRDRFGNDTHIAYAVNAYDMLHILLAESAAQPGKDALLKSMESAQPRKGVCTSFTYKNDPEIGAYFAYPVTLYQIVDGKAQLLKR